MADENQFLSIKTYGKKPGKDAKKWQCIAGILAEAGRVPGACGHVAQPEPPTLLFGSVPQTVIPEAVQLADDARDAAGRRLRVDGNVLVAGVASWPVPWASINEAAAERARYYGWRKAMTDDLVSTIGPALRSVVEHTDESHPHLHWVALPALKPDRTLDWAHAHPGLQAKRAAAEARQDNKAQNKAYRAGMIAWQDDVFERVSRHWGLDRYGPYKTAMGRREALREAESQAKFEAWRDELKQRAAGHVRTLFQRMRAAEAEVARLRQVLADHGLDHDPTP